MSDRARSETVVVTHRGRLSLYRKKSNLSTYLAGQAVGNQGSRRRHLARQLH